MLLVPNVYLQAKVPARNTESIEEASGNTMGRKILRYYTDKECLEGRDLETW